MNTNVNFFKSSSIIPFYLSLSNRLPQELPDRFRDLFSGATDKKRLQSAVGVRFCFYRDAPHKVSKRSGLLSGGDQIIGNHHEV